MGGDGVNRLLWEEIVRQFPEWSMPRDDRVRDNTSVVMGLAYVDGGGLYKSK